MFRSNMMIKQHTISHNITPKNICAGGVLSMKSLLSRTRAFQSPFMMLNQGSLQKCLCPFLTIAVAEHTYLSLMVCWRCWGSCIYENNRLRCILTRMTLKAYPVQESWPQISMWQKQEQVARKVFWCATCEISVAHWEAQCSSSQI